MHIKRTIVDRRGTDWTMPDMSGFDKAHEGFLVPPKVRPGRIQVTLEDAIVLVGSDGHWWPEQAPPASRAFVAFAKMLQPDLIILNGDAFDGAGISRFSEMAWSSKARLPTVAEQLDGTRDELRELELAAKDARKIWTLGNHDARFETYLIARAPEFAGVTGVSLKDHFAGWEPAWSVEINEDVMIKHRFRGGIHAVYNNVLKSGRTIITGHLHSLQVRPITDYNGTRWGVDCGFLSDHTLPQFEYLEDNPVDWRSGFCVLTFRGGRLLWPETVWVRRDGVIEWRGELL